MAIDSVGSESPRKVARSPSVVNDVYLYQQDELQSFPSLNRLVAYYEGKTNAILQRYGPGPRVHFHTGLGDMPSPTANPAQLRTHLVEAQELMLHYAVEVWRLHSVPFKDVLDVGCGLGGGAIFWAQELGAKVMAITIAPSHIKLVRTFAAQAGVGDRVVPLLCDALSVPGEACFDAVVAIDSSSSFPREIWFQRLARLLRRGGRVFIFDCFLVSAEYEELFNSHWCALIGTLEEYFSAASRARFTLEMFEDVSERAVQFWTTTLALMRSEMHDRSPSELGTCKSEESLRAHALMREGLSNGGLRHAFMSFVRH
jgi:tocopherol O-methyltransferase